MSSRESRRRVFENAACFPQIVIHVNVFRAMLPTLSCNVMSRYVNGKVHSFNTLSTRP